MKISVIALALALVAVPIYVVKHHQPATRQIAGPPGSIPPCPPFCATKPIDQK